MLFKSGKPKFHVAHHYIYNQIFVKVILNITPNVPKFSNKVCSAVFSTPQNNLFSKLFGSVPANTESDLTLVHLILGTYLWQVPTFENPGYQY